MTWAKRQADAFVTLLKEYLSGSESPSGKCTDNYLVNIHVDHSALAGEAGKSSLPIESVKRLCCDGSAVVIGEDGNGQPLNIGRKTRIVPKAIERTVRTRDNHRCVFPGCKNKRFLDCHHVEHWSNGGETSVDNLILLCTKHHTLVHEGGFRLDERILKVDRLRLRGMSGAWGEFLLAATAQNLRRMAGCLGTGPPGSRDLAVT